MRWKDRIEQYLSRVVLSCGSVSGRSSILRVLANPARSISDIVFWPHLYFINFNTAPMHHDFLQLKVLKLVLLSLK